MIRSRRVRGGAPRRTNTRRPDAAAPRAADIPIGELLDALPQGIVVLDPEGRYRIWNKRYAEIYAGSADLFAVGRRLEDTLRIGIARAQYPDAIGREEDWLAARMDRMRNPRGQIEQQLSDGRWILIDERRTSDGGYIGLRVDITDLKEREASFRLLFEANPVPMFVVAHDTGALIAANTAAVEHYRLAGPEAVGSFRDLQPDWEPAAGRTAGNAWDATHTTTDGRAIEVTCYARPLTYQGRRAFLISAFDMTERNRAVARAAFLAHHDGLTGLANRVHLDQHLEDRAGEAYALLAIDLDRFKIVNDTLGHQSGDALLVEVARRLRSTAGAHGFVARLGGDEFVVVTERTDPADLSDLSARIIAGLGEPVDIQGRHASVGASIGIAIAGPDGSTADELFRSADLALYRAKSQGRNAYEFFEAGMNARLQARRRMEFDLSAALRNNEFEVHYQPLVDLSSGRINGYEALIRWRHPERGPVSPAEFIPIAEEVGLIGDIGAFVLGQACRDATRWEGEAKVAVNISPAQMRAGTLFAHVSAALAASGLPATRLELEITEALLLERTDTVLATLHALRNLGVSISMDDFGTGYSSLSYLRSFPFDKIKIDRSFIRDMAASEEAAAIVRTIVDLGANLGIKVTAEGIEDGAVADLLRRQGCAEGQGFHFARPKPLDEVLAELEAFYRPLRRA